MIDGLERVRRHPQPDRAAERVRDHGDVEQVGQESSLGLDVGMAHLVPDLGGLPVSSHRHDMGNLENCSKRRRTGAGAWRGRGCWATYDFRKRAEL